MVATLLVIAAIVWFNWRLARQTHDLRAAEALAKSMEGAGALSEKDLGKRIKQLERDLLRKDRALAETAALLVLSKKLETIFQKDRDEDE